MTGAIGMGEWISVKWRLPEPGQRVVVYTENQIPVYQFEVVKFHRVPGEGDEIPRWMDAKGHCYSGPTHWMPLPAPPESGQGAKEGE